MHFKCFLIYLNYEVLIKSFSMLNLVHIHSELYFEKLIKKFNIMMKCRISLSKYLLTKVNLKFRIIIIKIPKGM